MRKLVPLLVILCLAVTSLANAEGRYKLSMLPNLSAEEINNRITPLANYLSAKLSPTQIEPVVASDFKDYERRLKSGDIAIGYENPNVYVQISDSHEAIAVGSEGKDGYRFRGLIITRADSNILALEDLRGKTISIVGLTSAGGYLSQRVTLLQEGFDPDKDFKIVEALENKQENVIFAVYQGDVDAGFIRESALHSVDTYVPPSQIKVIKRTALLPNWALSVSRDMPPALKKQIVQEVMSLAENHEVLKALKINSFQPAKDADYDGIRQALGITTHKK